MTREEMKTRIFFVYVDIYNDHAFAHDGFSLHFCDHNELVWEFFVRLVFAAFEEGLEALCSGSFVFQGEF